MKTMKLIRHIGDFVSLWIIILNMMDRQIELVDQPALQTLDVSQRRIQARTLASNIFEITFTCNPSKVLIEHPSKADKVFHELAPGGSLVWMLHPRSKIAFQFRERFLDARLAVIQAHLHAIHFPNVTIHCRVPQTDKGLLTLKNFNAIDAKIARVDAIQTHVGWHLSAARHKPVFTYSVPNLRVGLKHFSKIVI